MSGAFENGTEQWPVGELWVDTVSVRSVDVDWTDRAGEDWDGWQSFEAPDCPECGEYAVWEADADEGPMWTCPNKDCERYAGEIDTDGSSEGPMMNYYYPLPDLHRVDNDPNEAASRIRDLPLCVVSFEDDSEGFALALTGGGMDLSWEICEAFTRLGYLPPLAFCDLPAMAGKQVTGDAAYTVAACKRSADVARYQAERTLERLNEQYPEAVPA